MKSDLKKNIIYQCLYEMLVIIAPLITAPIVARALGPECSGIYSYTYSIAGYFVLFCMLGIKNHGSRIIAEKSENQQDLNRAFSSVLTIHVIVSAVVFLLYIAYVFTISSEDYRLFALLQGLYVLSALFDISWFFIGIEQFKLTVTRNITIKLITIVLIIACVKTNADLWKYILIMSGGILISQVWLWAYLGRFVQFVKPEKKEVIHNIKPLLILFVPVIAVSLYKMMDKIMIGWYSKPELGFYEYSEKIIAVPMSIIEAIGVVMLPRISKMLARGSVNESKSVIQLSLKYNMILAIAMAFGLAGISKEFAPAFFGTGYEACAILMTGLAFTIPFLSFANVLRKQYMIPMKMERAYIMAVFAGAIVNLICNMMLVPKMYSRGAMVGTILAEIVVCLMHMLSCRTDLPIKESIYKIIPYLWVGAIMYLTVRYIAIHLKASLIGVVIEIVVGAIVYIIGTCLVLYIQHDETFIHYTRRLKSKLLH